MTSSKPDLAGMIERVERSREVSNALDIEIDIALFRPDAVYASVKPNAAGTKLVYARRDGRRETFWAFDHTLNTFTRAAAVALLRALQSTEATR